LSSYPALSYVQASACGASPIGLVVSLYDTILRDFVRALAAVEAGDVETRVFELNHALLVMAHLQSVLDHQRGGEAAKQFDRFYSVTRWKIVEANIQSTPESLEELIHLYGGMRQAWYQAGQQLSVDQQQTPSNTRSADASGMHAVSPANEEIETPQLHWST
jgi:flagellar protein FliS